MNETGNRVSGLAIADKTGLNVFRTIDSRFSVG
jgi:hypothetical protein